MIVIFTFYTFHAQAKVKHEKETDGKGSKWEVGDFKEPPSPTFAPRQNPKPVDEDLYKISPDLLYAKTKKVILS